MILRSQSDQKCGAPQGQDANPKGSSNLIGVPVREPIQVESPGEADGIFLRETPDRCEVVDPERCRCHPLRFLAARLHRLLVVKRGVDPDVCFRGDVGSGMHDLQDEEPDRTGRAPCV